LIDIIRILVPGITLGILMGEFLARKPQYFRSLDPRLWVNRIKEASGSEFIRNTSLTVIFGGVMFFTSLFVSQYVSDIWGPTIAKDNVFADIEGTSFLLFAVSISFLPILEEWLFRGVILEEIARRSNSKWIGLFLSSLIFAAFHLTNPGTNLAAIIPYSVGGLVLGISYLVGGLSVAIGCHVMYNLLLLILP